MKLYISWKPQDLDSEFSLTDTHRLSTLHCVFDMQYNLSYKRALHDGSLTSLIKELTKSPILGNVKQKFSFNICVITTHAKQLQKSELDTRKRYMIWHGNYKRCNNCVRGMLTKRHNFWQATVLPVQSTRRFCFSSKIFLNLQPAFPDEMLNYYNRMI